MSDSSDTETAHPAMPLPLPGSPGSSWAAYRERFKAVFHDADPRICAAFWCFGMYIFDFVAVVACYADYLI
jgi:battenin